ncbi:MAG TPA: hypothetical protein PKA57_06475 [Parvibaculum sp.]|uniref:hypothetical protein n=1 Tax=Parvibaculum sp. TaxID=2024848 RepID=UPI002B7B3D3B|nr:hypothetical protein [Parvibaculum sp.]HMM14257.1 hypothetical protein [Parvibaculum sp.]
MTITTYTLRAASAGELHAMLAEASAGKARAYAWTDEEGMRFDEARVRLPYPEMLDEEPTGAWLCDVALIGETDATLVALAQSVTSGDQAASG